LIEGKDFRGIDTALITKFNIVDSNLHYISFSGEFEGKDTRPILEATLDVMGKNIKIYNVHFPSGFHDVSMRLDSLKLLKELLLNQNDPAIALGDFNVNTKEDNKLNIYQSQQEEWIVAHLVGCNSCKGSYYYNYSKTWEYLDTIFLSKDRGISYVPESIDIHNTPNNAYSDTGKPIKFNAINKYGVSDHLPMVAKFKIDTL
jgi:endonuclease/exonuclease/phosphatase family metal-dependent hydrolase